jgi:hypothetical protein
MHFQIGLPFLWFLLSPVLVLYPGCDCRVCDRASAFNVFGPLGKYMWPTIFNAIAASISDNRIISLVFTYADAHSIYFNSNIATPTNPAPSSAPLNLTASRRRYCNNVFPDLSLPGSCRNTVYAHTSLSEWQHSDTRLVLRIARRT